MLLNATVAESIGEIITALKAEMKKTRNRDDAVLKVVSGIFKTTKAVRFEGNNYSDAWVVEAKKRGLPNLRRTPEALAQIVAPASRTLFTSLGILSPEEVDSRYHIRLERYIKDMLIELHTLAEMTDTMILPAAHRYLAMLVDSAVAARSAGIKPVPQVDAANAVSAMVADLHKAAAALHAVIGKAEGMHDDAAKQAQYLTSAGADAMAAVRTSADALELKVDDACWPLPRYREMVFPV
jgi:glutamine synthetase